MGGTRNVMLEGKITPKFKKFGDQNEELLTLFKKNDQEPFQHQKPMLEKVEVLGLPAKTYADILIADEQLKEKSVLEKYVNYISNLYCQLGSFKEETKKLKHILKLTFEMPIQEECTWVGISNNPKKAVKDSVVVSAIKNALFRASGLNEDKFHEAGKEFFRNFQARAAKLKRARD